MMPVEVVIGEVPVVDLGHAQLGQELVDPAWFVHNLVSYCDLGSRSEGADKDHSKKADGCAPAKLEILHTSEEFDVVGPVHRHGREEGQPEPLVLAQKFLALLLRGIPLVQAEYLVEEGEYGEGDSDEGEGAGVVPQKVVHKQQGHKEVGERGVDEAVFPEHIQFVPGQPLLQLVYYCTHLLYTILSISIHL